MICFRLLPRRYSPYLLIAGSLVFYWYGVRSAPWQMLLLLAMTALGMIGCAVLNRHRGSRGLLAFWVAVIAAPLVYVKLAGLFTADPPHLPLGLSFYTFQLIAFLVYAREGGKVSPAGVAAGTLFFSKLLSGPIGDAAETLETVSEPKRRPENLDSGLELFILGLAAKVIVADHLAGLQGQIHTWGVSAVSSQMAWLGMIGFALQLYFDFWGYSLMAVGTARMLGMRLPDNFNHPYCSLSIREFWRRWHITLGMWFRKHVYIPLGGSRNGTGRMITALFTVWILTGIWHGAGWNYVCWGMMMFLLIMGERFIYGGALERYPALGHVYVPLMVALSWVFFTTSDPQGAFEYFGRLFVSGQAGDPDDWINALKACWPYLALGCVFSTPLPGKIWRRVSGRAPAWVILFGLFWVCMYFLSIASSDPFLYFSF